MSAPWSIYCDSTRHVICLDQEQEEPLYQSMLCLVLIF